MGGGGPLGPPEWREANVNELTDTDNIDPLSGFPVYKALLCDVTRAAGASERDDLKQASSETVTFGVAASASTLHPTLPSRPSRREGMMHRAIFPPLEGPLRGR
jgi:hypothetical protein